MADREATREELIEQIQYLRRANEELTVTIKKLSSDNNSLKDIIVKMALKVFGQ